MRPVIMAGAFVTALTASAAASAATPEVGGTVGFEQRWLHAVPISSLGVTVEPGFRTPGVALTIPIALAWGRTWEGLDVYHVGVGFLVEGVFDRVRLGAGGSTGLMVIDRATYGTFRLGYFDGMVRFSVDFARFGQPRPLSLEDPSATTRSAVFLALEFHGSTALTWGPSALVGVRY